MEEQENISQNISIYGSQQFHQLKGKDQLVKSIFENYQQLQDVLNYSTESCNFLITIMNTFFGDKQLTYSIVNKKDLQNYVNQISRLDKKFYEKTKIICTQQKFKQEQIQLNLYLHYDGSKEQCNLLQFYDFEYKTDTIKSFVQENLFQKIVKKALLIVLYTFKFSKTKKLKEIQNLFFILFSQFCYKYFSFVQKISSFGKNVIQSEKNLSEKIIGYIKDKEISFEIQQMIEFFIQKQIQNFRNLYKQNIEFYIVDKNKMLINMQNDNQNTSKEMRRILNQINFSGEKLILNHQNFKIFPIYIEGYQLDNTFLAVKQYQQYQIIQNNNNLSKDLQFEIDTYKIDYLQINDSDTQFKTVFYMFEKFDLFNIFNLSPKKFGQFLCVSKKLYELNSNPYHNFKHGLTVLNGCYYFLTKDIFVQNFQNIGILALLFASLMHDVKHPGYNNDFMVKKDTEIALTYNDKSVLENYHISTAFQILRQQQYNFMEHVQNEEYKNFRKIVIQSILMTDPSKHFKHLKKLQNLIQQKVSFYQQDSFENFMFLCGSVTHACDLHGPIKPYDQEMQWSRLVNEEFKNQLVQEQNSGLTLTQMFVQIDIPEKQGMIRPLWVSFNELFECEFQEQLDILDENIEQWEKRKLELLQNQLYFSKFFNFQKRYFILLLFSFIIFEALSS